MSCSPRYTDPITVPTTDSSMLDEGQKASGFVALLYRQRVLVGHLQHDKSDLQDNHSQIAARAANTWDGGYVEEVISKSVRLTRC